MLLAISQTTAVAIVIRRIALPGRSVTYNAPFSGHPRGKRAPPGQHYQHCPSLRTSGKVLDFEVPLGEKLPRTEQNREKTTTRSRDDPRRLPAYHKDPCPFGRDLQRQTKTRY